MKKELLHIQRKEYIKNIAIFTAILFLAGLFFYSLTLQQIYQNLVEGSSQVIKNKPVQGAIIFIIIEMLAVMISPFSSVPFLLIAIEMWGKTAALTYSIIGGLLGATAAYFIGYYAVHHMLKKIIPSDDIKHYGKIIAKHSSFWTAVLFILAMPVELPGYVLGTVRYKYWKYILATMIGQVPFYVIAIFAGQAFIERNTAAFITTTVSFVALLCACIYFFFKKIRKN